MRSVLDADIAATEQVLVVTGYAALEEVVRLIVSVRASTKVRILFGNEPYPTESDDYRLPGESIAHEVRDFWLERNVSVELSAALIATVDRLESGQVSARIAGRKPMHAKIYVTDSAVTVGSSNFTRRGLGSQSEANARFVSGEHFDATRDLAEGLWQTAEDWTDGLVALLHALLRVVTWQEALARACAVVLDGEWAAKYMPGPDDLAEPLWPHQRQGLARAMHRLIDTGSVLVADAAGSGKTRLGTWVLRGLQDHLLRTAKASREPFPALFAPPAVVPNWEAELPKANLNWRTLSHGPLSNPSSHHHATTLEVLDRAEVLAVDEAHNFLNPSERTRRLRLHAADNVVLFTATPINRGPADLLALVELLGPDNFDDDTLDRLVAVGRYRSGLDDGLAGQILADLKKQIRSFMVRRTRGELNAISDRHADAFVGPPARYPKHTSRYYDLPCSEPDRRILEAIDHEASQLRGVNRVGDVLQLSAYHKANGIDDATMLRMRLSSAAALARYTVLRCLRSSRIALVEHALGTSKAVDLLAPELRRESAGRNTGDLAGGLRAMAGKCPKWKLAPAVRQDAPDWVVDRAAHAAAAEEEASRFERIAKLACQLSGDRERAKADHLAHLNAECGKVIAYDGSLLTLQLFERLLRDNRVPAARFTGRGGSGAKREARRLLGRDATGDGIVALCTDALSEGMNLQGANCVVHLDTPTVIRVAEQRAGRVDRMDSHHEEVHVWWPREPEVLLPRRGEVIRERHEVVSDLIGANLQLPDDAPRTVESLAEEAQAIADEDLDGLFDAFRPVRGICEALLPPGVYDRMSSSQADVVACVAAVPSESAWGFFAIGGIERRAPRWVFVGESDPEPRVDFDAVANALEQRLTVAAADRAFDSTGSEILGRLLDLAGRQEDLLLTTRRRRAIALAKEVFLAWSRTAWAEGDTDRGHYLRAWLEALSLDGTVPRPDPRAFADAWIRLLRPLKRQLLVDRGRGKRPLTLDKLAGPLRDEPIDTEKLRTSLRAVPVLPPVGRRVVAAIVGVPT